MNRQQRRAEARLGHGRVIDSRATSIAQRLNAALVHQRAGRAADAERVCRHILSVDPGHAQTLHLLGLIEHQCGRSDAAIEHIRAAIARNGEDPAFHHNLGNILRARDRTVEASACYERALALAPNSVDSLYNLGNLCHELGQPEQAIAYFERALRLNPNAAELHNNLGLVLQDLGRLDDAVDCFRRARVLRPEAVEILDNFAGALRAKGELDAARAFYERALALRPDHVESHVGLGVILREQGRPEEAVARYERALVLAPDHPAIRNNLGVALVDLGRLEEAQAQHNKVLALQPDSAETHYNIGVAFMGQGRHAEALASYGRALALRPDYPLAHLNRAIALLRIGEFGEGWEEYEWRFAAARYHRNVDRPLWSGEPLGGRSILIHAEQGFGDTLQFVRYVPAVAERGGRVVLEVQEPILRLARTVEGASQVLAAGDPLPPIDCHCPLLSLPRVFETNLTTIPSRVPYLSVPPEALRAWAERMAAAPGLRVGIVWAGTAVGAIELRLLQPLWEVTGVRWFSLQAGDRSADISLLDTVKIADLSPWLTDFAETGAAVCQLDLVISVDTSVAHLSGALGRPTWILLPHASEWRWLLDREDSPWYPTVRLFRQKKPGDWASLSREVAAALTQITR